MGIFLVTSLAVFIQHNLVILKSDFRKRVMLCWLWEKRGFLFREHAELLVLNDAKRKVKTKPINGLWQAYSTPFAPLYTSSPFTPDS